MIKYAVLEQWRCNTCDAIVTVSPGADKNEMEKLALNGNIFAPHEHQWEKIDEEGSSVRSDGSSGSEAI
ncbi:MAG: hypothetical protein WC666_04190 [Candidatus Paceibacterota bacterium]|jgi:hypothetical protein